MALLLAIETTTRNCSVALFRDNNLLQIIEQLTDKYLHAEQLNIFIESILIKNKGDITLAHIQLGLSKKVLLNKIEKLGIDKDIIQNA